MVTLAQLWFKFFEYKIFSEFNIKFSDLESDFTLSPLVYTFLKYKQIIPKPRAVFEQPNLLDNCNEKIKNKWLLLKKNIESGIDINPFMSKKNLQWKDMQKNTIIDYLYITTSISHFHLRKNSKGGIGDELVFGIFHQDNFYALKIGNHSDLYNLESFKEILEENFSRINVLDKINSSVELFKRLANDVNHQPHFIYSQKIPEEYDNELGLINYNIDGNNYRVPIKVFSAYENEIRYIGKIESLPFSPVGLKLEIDLENREYVIYRKNFLEPKQELKRISLPKIDILCSSYKQG